MDARLASPTFDPTTDPKAYRKALGRFTTGIAVVTAIDSAGAPIGITVNSFASLSLAPALIMWAPAKNSNRHDPFVAAPNFAVHVLSADQKAVCDQFVKNMYGFDGIAYEQNAEGVPVIEGSLAAFECATTALHDAGDHTMIVGEVTRVRERGGEALIFHNGLIKTL